MPRFHPYEIEFFRKKLSFTDDFFREKTKRRFLRLGFADFPVMKDDLLPWVIAGDFVLLQQRFMQA